MEQKEEHDRVDRTEQATPQNYHHRAISDTNEIDASDKGDGSFEERQRKEYERQRT